MVVDPEYGDRLDALAGEMPVWVADTPVNRVAAEALWRRAPVGLSHTAPGAVTIFRVPLGAPPAEWALAVLDDVDLHHDENSHTPPYTALEIIGTGPTPDLQDALRNRGLTEVELHPDGFRASSPRVA